MVLGVLYMSIFLPLSIKGVSVGASFVAKPYLVQATIDSARIIGLPSSRAAREYAQKKQALDPGVQVFYFNSEPVTWRKLFFREYFGGGL